MVRCAYHSDWDGAMKLAWDTFVRFDAPDYSQEGIENFYKFVNDDMLRKCSWQVIINSLLPWIATNM